MLLTDDVTAELPHDGSVRVADLRRAFDAHRRTLTVGAEEELMLLDAATLELAPVSARILARAGGDPRFSAELPAAQLEIVTPVCAHAGDVRDALLGARRDLVALAGPDTRLAGAGTHPFAAPEGAMSDGARYEQITAEYQWAARRGLAWGLHVHVAVRGADRALSVHDALRSHLPQLAALAGNAPFHAGADTGLHSVRPKLAEGFPRQGIPPAWGTWEAYAEFLRWGVRDGAYTPDGRQLWWEVRLHPGFGTLEVRVCDQPATVAEGAALVAVVQALCHRLVEEYDAGVLRPPVARERIEENRWRALRHGLDGTLLNLDDGRAEGTRTQLTRLLGELEPRARELGSHDAFAGVWPLLEQTGSQRQRGRAAAADGDLRAVVRDLTTRFETEVAAGSAAMGSLHPGARPQTRMVAPRSHRADPGA